VNSEPLDPVIHAPARLRIVATLATLPDGDEVSFTRLQDILVLTPGNLITHLRKLEDAGYVSTEKTGNGTAGKTTVALTGEGRKALDDYTQTLRGLLDGLWAGPECRTPAVELNDEPPPEGDGEGGGGTVRPVTDLQRKVAPFRVVTDMIPAGDQPTAIAEIDKRVRAGEKDIVLLGATGTGKTATVAWVAERLQRPVLVMLPNKTLAAQFANELREMLPDNAVEYFVSYYDYYQPEAYLPQTDTYIEKDSSINDEVERLRHSATNSLLTRRDTVVVASVSCIYGLGTPQEYVDRMLTLRVGDTVEREALLRQLVGMQYNRNDMSFTRGSFRVRGDTIEIIPQYEELAVRIEMFGDEVERLSTLHPLTGEVISEDEELYVFPASHYVAGEQRMERAIAGIEAELGERLAELERGGKLLEAQRLRMRTTYDIEMMRQVGSCSGIENYSRHIDGREAGSPPNTLLDYFPEDFLLVIDESHQTVPQIGAMYEGDVSRKRMLVEHGFRLPSAIDNRPLTWDEFGERIGQTIYLSATPGPYELQRVGGDVVEQVIRPTGLVDPQVIVKPTKGQIDDLLEEIRLRTERDERVLVTTLTKKMSEDLTDYLLENGVRARYLHSEVDTLRRIELLRELRLGEFDVLVGINLLREGLDLPEVSLVAILDADKEGFLRSPTSLIQTIGRAARNISGEVHMYADKVTAAMRHAIDETNRRREKQVAYNTANGINPTPLRKRIADILDQIFREDADTEQLIGGGGRQQSRGKSPVPGLSSRARAAAIGAGGAEPATAGAARGDLVALIQELTDQMHAAAAELQFEVAARLRDEIKELKHELRGMHAAGV
jgi:excinuclease ABC subunit B